jgi:hypothetical protein
LRVLDVRQPFTRADASAAGFDPTRSREYVRIFHGVYVSCSVPVTPQVRVRAALTFFGPQSFASHASAARVLGVPIPPLPDEHVTVLAANRRRRPSGVVPHVDPSPDVRIVDGIRVSAPCQMFVELASLLSLVDLVVVGDHLVRRRLATRDQLVSHCAETSARGAAPARRAAAYVRDRVDSPMETRLRMLIVLAGIPEPAVNLTLRAGDGTPLRRYDLCWPSVRVIVEYNGRHHIEREEQWEADLDRREADDEDGWRTLVVTGRGIYREPGRTVDRVWRALRTRHLPAVPDRPSDDWRPHFPS